jgi:transcription initiation factor TFIID TATA-box-binding protein
MSENKNISIKQENSSTQDLHFIISNDDNYQKIVDNKENEYFSPSYPEEIQKFDELNNKCDEQDEQSEQNFMIFPGDGESQESENNSDNIIKTPAMRFKFNDHENENFVENKNDEKSIKKEMQPNISSKETKETTTNIGKISLIKNEPYIANITCNVNLNCIINLKTILFSVKNVKYNPKKNNFLIMKLEKSNITANIFSSGKMTCCGAKSKEELYKALKKYKKIIKKCGFDVHIKKKQIVIRNIVSTCAVNFKIPLSKLFVHLNKICKTGEIVKKPKQHPGLIYKKKIENSNICYVFYNSGKITITGAKEEEHIHEAFKNIYPELLKVKMP